MTQPTFVVGTAGHVDHGKSSLVRALTGTDPDRLAEEQLRQMTIDLGFAELATPAGNHVHLIDVPGHERFISNMLAGAGGIDAALLTIAADDGPMPQTREHLAILDLLGIDRGVVALNKADLVDDEWIAFVTESIRELLRPTALAAAEIVPISSVTGAGLPRLLEQLDRVLQPIERHHHGIPRLPIDRVFTMSGFGTIVTGTLLDGQLRTGDRVAIQPGNIESRVRGLQTFGLPVDVAVPGSRVAVNLTGLETSQLARGQVLTIPAGPPPAMRLDVSLSLLASSTRALQHNDEVVIFTGSSETPAKAALLQLDNLEPSQTGWAQLRLARPVATMPGDRFILRRPSPPETIGGGTILELDAPRHRRGQPAVIERLQRLAAGDPADALLAWLGDRFVTEAELRNEAPPEIIRNLSEAGRLRLFGASAIRIAARPQAVAGMQQRLRCSIDGFHTAFPLEPGFDRETLRNQLGTSRALLEALLSETGDLVVDGSRIRRADFRIQLTPDQQRAAETYLTLLDGSGFQPPSPEEARISQKLVRAMESLNLLVAVGDGIWFRPRQIDAARTILIDAITIAGSISLAEYRDLLPASRKYAQALLEYFDRQRVTRRIGDRRILIGAQIQREGD